MTLVRDIMQSDVITTAPDAPVSQLVKLLEDHEISGVPVVGEGDALVGVVSSRDVTRLAADLDRVPEAMRWGLGVASPRREGGFLDLPEEGEFFAYYVTPGGQFVDVRDQIRELPGTVFEGYKVEDVMTSVPFTIEPDAPLSKLAGLLRERRVHRALVVESGALVGIVTTMDILEVLAGD